MPDLILKPERAISVGLFRKGFSRTIASEHIDELKFLAETAGAEIIGEFTQELEKPIGATQIGSGKVQEIKTVPARPSRLFLLVARPKVSAIGWQQQ